MNTPPKRNPGGRRRPGKATFTTKSGNTIKLNQSLNERIRAKRDAKARNRAAYLGSLPQNRLHRILYRLHPKRVVKYWFSREGAIMALKLTGIGIVLCFILLVGVFAYFRKDLPNIKDISGNKLGGSITYYDRTGQTVLWQDYSTTKRIQVKGDQIAPYLKQATVAIEDKDFYHEGAFNIRGIIRAGIHDVFGGGGTVQGGSTITQQLVKLNQKWTADRTITRKIKELILAVDLEREYSKSDILTGYLNVAPYGGIDYGIETASRDYFNTSASTLTLEQAALLAAIPQNPSQLSPYNSPAFNSSISYDEFHETALLNRQHYILDQMVKQGYVKQAQADAAKKVDIMAQIHPLPKTKYSSIEAPYFVLAAKQQLKDKYGALTVQHGGWKVITTLDMNLQKTAENLVAKNRANVVRYGGDEEATVAVDVKTSQVVALVGGVDFQDPEHGEINYAQNNLSPGSSFKPYDYVSLINDTTNTGAGSVLYDSIQPLPGYLCTNTNQPRFDKNGNCLWDYDFKFPNAIPIRYALAGSRNVPAVKAMLTVGTDKVISTANAMMGNPDAYKCYATGVDVSIATKKDEVPCYGASAIGDGAYLHLDDHANGLATMARLGNALPKSYILKVTDSSNKDLYTWSLAAGTQVVRPDAAFIINDILSDPKATYLNAASKFQTYKGWKFAIKTGTTNDNYDGLMTSWSTQYAVASWVGYHTRNKALTNGHMEDVTEPLTKGLMTAAHDALNMTPVNWTKPVGVKTLPAFVLNGWTVSSGAILPSSSQDYYPSWYVQKAGDAASQTIDKVSGKVATSCTPDAAKETGSGANANIFSADIRPPAGFGGGAASVTASDDTHKCDDAKPLITLTPPATCTVGVACQFTVTVTAGTHPLSSTDFPGVVNLTVNGVKQSQNISDAGTSTVTFTYMPTASGPLSAQAEVIDSVLYSSTDSKTLSTNDAPTTPVSTGH